MSDKKNNGWKKDGKPKSRKMAILIFGPLVLVVLGGGFYLKGDRYISTDNAYIKTEKISISTEVTGKIVKVNVSDNGRVAKGEELFLIDPQPFEIAVSRAEANLDNVQAEIESIRARYLQKRAEFDREKDTVHYREKEYNRYKGLVAKRAVSQERWNQAEYDYKAAQKNRDAALQEAQSLKAQLEGKTDSSTEDHSRYRQAKAELAKAQLDLSHVKILAPADGVAANVTLSPGEYTVAGLPLFTLVKDGRPWIEANFKETDLTHMRLGQHAEVRVDSYPGIKWDAEIVSITPATGSEFSILPPQNSSGNWVKVVQRIMVRLALLDNRGKPYLRAGMSSTVKVDTGKSRMARLFENRGKTKE